LAIDTHRGEIAGDEPQSRNFCITKADPSDKESQFNEDFGDNGEVEGNGNDEDNGNWGSLLRGGGRGGGSKPTLAQLPTERENKSERRIRSAQEELDVVVRIIRENLER
jgi:hypothetical protein